MKLTRVSGRPFQCVCKLCKQTVWAGDDYNTRADLAGEPFAAYYCKLCTKELEEEGKAQCE